MSTGGFGSKSIEAAGGILRQRIGYQLRLLDDGECLIRYVALRSDGGFELSLETTIKADNLDATLREALAVLMVLPKEGGYIAGIGARTGDEFYIERGRVD